MPESFFTVAADVAAVVNLAPKSKGFDIWAPFQTRIETAEPVSFLLKSGSHRVDCLYGGAPTVLLVSDRLKEQLADCSGIAFFPIELRDAKGLVEKFHWGLNVLGRCGAIDFGRIPAEATVQVSENLSIVTGVQVDEQKWDGSDVFCFTNLGKMLITKRTAERLERAKLKGVTLKDISALSIYRRRGE